MVRVNLDTKCESIWGQGVFDRACQNTWTRVHFDVTQIFCKFSIHGKLISDNKEGAIVEVTTNRKAPTFDGIGKL